MGFLRSIAAAIRQFKPTRCIIVFDGKGGSTRRKKLHSGYKEGRSMSTRFNRIEDIGFQTVEEELESMRKQMGRLSEYLQNLPITVISIDNIEADDSIAYLTTDVFRPKNSEVIIMSDDKDFIQLIDEKTSVWRPVEKKLYTPKEVLARFGIPVHNFIHYKIFMGDASDNIPGIKGIGIKTLQKKFPILLEDSTYSVDDLIEYAKQHINDHKIYKQVVDSKETLQLGKRLMSLENLEIPGQTKLLIADIANSPIPELNLFQFKKLFMLDKLYAVIPNVDSWISSSFQTLAAYSRI